MNAYDFDKTIYKNDSTADFYIFCIKKNPVLFFSLFKTAAAAANYYIFKRGSKTKFKERMYSFLSKINAEALAEKFWDENIKKIKKFYLLQQRPNDIIISASPEFLLKPVCERLNIKHLIASRVDPNSGKYSGINCSGNEKVRRFYERFPDEKVEKFYSDSHSDDPMAAIAEQSFMVCGNKVMSWY